MKAEILCVGSELLLGETINTNAAFLSRGLSSIGIDCNFQTTVGDNPERIKIALDSILKRSDIIITSGGLGPTEDDLTVRSIAEYFKEELVLDENSLSSIKEYFKSLDRYMPEQNIKQAYRPKSAKHINNNAGTAPGLLWEIKQSDYPQFINSDKIIISLPGVPSEVYSMWDDFVCEYLKQFSSGILKTRHLKFIGVSEATLADKVKDFLSNSNPTVAPLVSNGETNLRIAAKADIESEAIKLIEHMQNDILSVVNEYYYGYDEDTIEKFVVSFLKEKSKTISVAESCTGGLISSKLTDISGSSQCVNLNLVTYSNDAKANMLEVSESTMVRHGAVSEETAREMAIGIRNKSDSDIGVSITGIAGPTGGTDEKPVGLCYVGIASKLNTEIYKILVNKNYTRLQIKNRFATRTLGLVRSYLLKYFT